MKSNDILLSMVAGILMAGIGLADAGGNLPMAPPVVEGNSAVRKAMEDWRSGFKYAAMKIARPLAQEGNADALFLLAYAMESPEPARQSRAQAMDYYYRRAAAAGHPEAELRRQLILLGSADEKERQAARNMLETAVNQGNARAGRILAEGWLKGLCDGKPTFSTAEALWKQSAEAGDAASFFLLAELYEGKFGFPDQVNSAAAIKCYREATGNGVKEAIVPLGAMLLNGPQDVRDEKEGRGWLLKASVEGDPEAWPVLAEYEEKVKEDKSAAMECYQRGAEAGQPECQWQIARRLPDHQPGSPARYWMKAAADQGNAAAAAELGRLLLNEGKDTLPMAYAYLLAAAKEGIPQAQYDLALYYLDGRAGQADEVSAVAWLTEAMKSGAPEAQYKLATLHEQGIGVPVNYANAGVLYTMACTKGHAGAAGRIAHMAMEGLGTKRSIVQAWAHASYAVERGDLGSKPLLVSLAGKLDTVQTAEAEKTLFALRSRQKPISPSPSALSTE